MKSFETDKLDDLADVFYAVLGGRPDNIREIEEIMKTNNLSQLLFASDIEQIFKYDGFFADETIDAVYALLPVKIPLNKKKDLILLPQTFRKLNAARIPRPASHIVNIDFQKAFHIYGVCFNLKIQEVIQEIHSLQQQKKARKQELEQKSQHNKETNMPKKQSESPKIAALKKAREDKKSQKPELLKAIDKKNNAKPSCKKAKETDYLLNKEKVDLKNKNNPNRPTINKRYKAKKRLKKTGPIISSLLQGLLAVKSR